LKYVHVSPSIRANHRFNLKSIFYQADILVNYESGSHQLGGGGSFDVKDYRRQEDTIPPDLQSPAAFAELVIGAS
jgi:hypothetical protein